MCISRMPAQKWSSQWKGALIWDVGNAQVAAYPVTPWCWPLLPVLPHTFFSHVLLSWCSLLWCSRTPAHAPSLQNCDPHKLLFLIDFKSPVFCNSHTTTNKQREALVSTGTSTALKQKAVPSLLTRGTWVDHTQWFFLNLMAVAIRIPKCSQTRS